MNEKELIRKIKQLENQLNQLNDNLDKLREAKKAPRFELSPLQIQALKAKGYKIN